VVNWCKKDSESSKRKLNESEPQKKQRGSELPSLSARRPKRNAEKKRSVRERDREQKRRKNVKFARERT
jgi:hypothetical protein